MPQEDESILVLAKAMYEKRDKNGPASTIPWSKAQEALQKEWIDLAVYGYKALKLYERMSGFADNPSGNYNVTVNGEKPKKA